MIAKDSCAFNECQFGFISLDKPESVLQYTRRKEWQNYENKQIIVPFPCNHDDA